jgi:hypothetical protein
MRINKFLKNLLTVRFAMVAGLLCYAGLATAVDRVYISDFSIAAGETKQISVNFDTDATDIKRVQFTINMPTGLTIVAGTPSEANNTFTADPTRCAGFLSTYNSATGGVALSGVGTKIAVGTGAIATFQVTATDALVDGSQITLTNVIENNGTNIDLANAATTVTKTALTSTDVLSIEDFTIAPGETKELTLNFATEATDIKRVQFTINMPTGLTIVAGTPSEANNTFTADPTRCAGFLTSYNSATGSVVLSGFGTKVAAGTGAIATFQVTATDALVDGSQITLTNVIENNGVNLSMADAAVTVTKGSLTSTDVLSIEDFSIAAGETKELTLNFATEAANIKRVQFTITMPTGLTIVAGTPSEANNTFTADPTRCAGFLTSYNSATGAVVLAGVGTKVAAGTGAIATFQVTASDQLVDGSQITLTNVKENNGIDLSCADATVTVSLTPADPRASLLEAIRDVEEKMTAQAGTLTPAKRAALLVSYRAARDVYDNPESTPAQCEQARLDLIAAVAAEGL